MSRKKQKQTKKKEKQIRKKNKKTKPNKKRNVFLYSRLSSQLPIQLICYLQNTSKKYETI
jgi:hypothetical protein